MKESNMVKPSLGKDTKRYLLNLYINDINKLEKLLNKDLSIWKQQDENSYS